MAISIAGAVGAGWCLELGAWGALAVDVAC